MIGWLSRRARPKDRLRGNRVRLGLDSLETRDCPAAPVIASATSQYTADGHVQISGLVQDDHPTTMTINSSGAATGSTTSGSDGHFNVTLPATIGMAVTLSATDDQNATAVLTTTVGSAVQNIQLTESGLTLTVVFDHWFQKQATVAGFVSGPHAAGATVVFSGALSGSVTAGSGGAFTYSAQANYLGTIDAVAYNSDGDASNDCYVQLTNQAPVITNFSITPSESGNNLWQVTLTISDESPGTLPVTVTGPGGAVVNAVQASSTGEFTWVITIPAGTTATFSATTTDWWGVQSNEATCFVQT
jgi:hypothetical protein